MRTRSLFVFGLCLVAFCWTQGVAAEDCLPDPVCTAFTGYCYTKGVANCSGNGFNWGCSDTNCACCVEDTSVCIPLSHCLERNGTCIGLNDTCTGNLLDNSCKGDDCQCCIHETGAPTPCNITDECKSYDGYCFKKGEYNCTGNSFNKGCSDVTCSCCVEDTSICIAKPTCRNADGYCQKRSEGKCKVREILKGCKGDDCICCVDDEDDQGEDE